MVYLAGSPMYLKATYSKFKIVIVADIFML